MVRECKEDQLHMAVEQMLFARLRNKDVFWFHPANGGARNPREGRKFKMMGVKAGVADIVFMLPDGRVACIELKTKTGRQTDPQKDFEAICRTLGVPYEICRSVEDVEKVLKDWGIL